MSLDFVLPIKANNIITDMLRHADPLSILGSMEHVGNKFRQTFLDNMAHPQHVFALLTYQ